MPRALTDIPLTRIDGQKTSLAAYRGKVLLVVNVASECGLTPQYEGLQDLYAAKRAQGLEVLGFPANNFGAQEPGSEAEIAAFCTANFGVEFPMFAKISVKGADRHPLYDALVAAQPKAEGTEAMRKSLIEYGEKPAPEIRCAVELREVRHRPRRHGARALLAGHRRRRSAYRQGAGPRARGEG